MDQLTILRNDLDRARGHWPRIANDTGLDHGTIARIARGDIPDPRFATVTKIRDWIDTHPDFLAAPAEEQRPEQAA